jgi:hypothetical protein
MPEKVRWHTTVAIAMDGREVKSPVLRLIASTQRPDV